MQKSFPVLPLSPSPPLWLCPHLGKRRRKCSCFLWHLAGAMASDGWQQETEQSHILLHISSSSVRLGTCHFTGPQIITAVRKANCDARALCALGNQSADKDLEVWFNQKGEHEFSSKNFLTCCLLRESKKIIIAGKVAGFKWNLK